MTDETLTFVEGLKKYISNYITLRKEYVPRRAYDLQDARAQGEIDGLDCALDYIDEFVTLVKNDEPCQ